MSILHKIWDGVLALAHRILDYVCRRRSFPLNVFRSGLMLIGIAGAGSLVSSLFYTDNVRTLSVRLELSGGTPELIIYAMFGLGVVLVIFGGIWEAIRFRREERREEERRARSRVVVIEQRGLIKSFGSPLKAALRDTVGVPQELLLDHTPYVENGSVTDADRIVRRVETVRRDLEARISDVAREDVTVVYGGVAPIPATFLAGFLIDDDGDVRIMDWDRERSCWRSLDAADDGERFEVVGLDTVPSGATEAAVAVNVSYVVRGEDVQKSLGGDVPLVQLSLPTIDKDNHWSDAKQRALAAQFLKVLKDLDNRGVRLVHLFVAAQNSVAFRLGQAYDQRNLPDAVINQYERSANPPHPWGVRLPTHGVDRPTIVSREPTVAMKGPAV